MKVHDGIARADRGRPRDPGLRARDLAHDPRATARRGRGRVHRAPAARWTGVPLVGGDLAGALRDAPRGATDPMRETGDEQGARIVRPRPRAGAADRAGSPNSSGWLDVPAAGAAPAGLDGSRARVRQDRRDEHRAADAARRARAHPRRARRLQPALRHADPLHARPVRRPRRRPPRRLLAALADDAGVSLR